MKLGVTARRGPRTGAAEPTWSSAEAVAEAFLKRFSTYCTDDRIKPPAADEPVFGGRTLVEDLRTGDAVQVDIILTQVSTEITLVGQRLKADGDRGFATPSAALTAMSPTYREIAKCLTPKGRRKYLQVAASAWERGVIPKHAAR